MKIDLKYPLLFLFSLLFFFGPGQTLELPLLKAGAQMYRGHVYAFGLAPGEKTTGLRVYRLNPVLAKTDSIAIELPKAQSADFLNISSDTLHDYLNIYLQKKEKKRVQIFRFDKNFKLVATPDDIDIARLNSIAAFETEIYYFKKDVYTIQTATDSTGKQFYLNRYSLKSDLENFEYERRWQFPFERKNINSAHIIFADTQFVTLFVNVTDGVKRGQWLLKVNALTGLLKRGTRIGTKGDLAFYHYGGVIMDTATKSAFLFGQKFNWPDFDQKENKLNLSGKPHVTIYLAQIDSLGDLVMRDEFKIPVAEQKGVVFKTPVNYLLRTHRFLRNKEGGYEAECDIFKGTGSQLCYTYCNSAIFKISMAEEQLTLEKNVVNTHPMIEKYYLSADKLDMNGKICVDSINEMEKLFYKEITFNVRHGYKQDETGNPVWLLKKTEVKKNSENYSTLGPVKKIYQITKIADTNKAENPAYISVSLKQFIISRQSAEDKFQLQIFNW